ncbi:hypothetical protein GCM10022225_74450 [Plantactinospora mayteni]|uniref:Uncharacterized protein n=1 Tax=Plantactinospora mayteni TaxID=566021 RepID=A0ABQ4EW81_9ACTN|nr:hypothetical protein Pma05_54690 [Plantactinospora mayteni]
MGFVECGQAVDITGVEPLDDETAQILGVRRVLSVGMHRRELATQVRQFPTMPLSVSRRTGTAMIRCTHIPLGGSAGTACDRDAP